MTRLRGHIQGGFALIEVLVSLLVLTIGILGLAGLQFYALKFNRSSYERSQAAAFAYELADKMRANYGPARSGAYSVALGSQPPTSPAKDCGAAVCTTAEIASYDLATWYGRLLAAIPSGKVEVTCADTPCAFTSQHRVTVYWTETTVQGLQLANCPVALVADTSCVSVSLQP